MILGILVGIALATSLWMFFKNSMFITMISNLIGVYFFGKQIQIPSLQSNHLNQPNLIMPSQLDYINQFHINEVQHNINNANNKS